MDFTHSNLMLIAGLAGIVFLSVALFHYDGVCEARDNRMKWLLRKQQQGIFGLRGHASARKWFTQREVIFSMGLGVIAFLSLIFSGFNIWGSVVISSAIAGVAIVAQGVLQKRQDRKNFEKSFPEAVEMLTRSVSTGVPLDEAFQSLSARFGGELSRRLEIFNSELALGPPFREAGVRFCKGLNMPDVEFFFAVISLNRESGSELTPALKSMSYTLRERQKIRRRAVVLTSEIRSSAKVMAALPVVMLGVMSFLNPGMISFYLHDFTGQIILLVCVLAMVIGFIIIRNIADVGD